ncbi:MULTISPECIES: SDR family NAD(P)-dependent oxidoreductase [unclassified Pseudofrankia]|uniref:SDR family NAD(P)-dependent oxidoreductase n=1 Tax=unclassified Pseudofrankia TaxID=2994372 RepID=UPI0008D8E602|nr:MULTISPECIES: SDR family oxidoreductase [unclassified Pseudofrankia]MDT3441907.1 SDR family oxidoreductase [Pseudofrankia sp. BMG5.37]OHV44554.1 3-oxoacyl-ACP reductase [Pseudofrankia sp. BMG5.36]
MPATAEFGHRVALVTGAAGQGIGRAVAARLVSGGAHTVVADVHPARIERVVAELSAQAPEGIRVLGKLLDVADLAAIDTVAKEIAEELGPIRVLVNNAAYNIMAPIWDYRPQDWARVMDTNVTGPWYLSKVAMTQMRAAGGGVIVNISTVAPDCGGMGLEGPYAVSKGGLNALTRSCAHEGGPYGIRANNVTMGLVLGTRYADVHHPDLVAEAIAASPMNALPHAVDIAEAVAFLASDRARFITGETLNVAAGQFMRY